MNNFGHQLSSIIINQSSIIINQGVIQVSQVEGSRVADAT